MDLILHLQRFGEEARLRRRALQIPEARWVEGAPLVISLALCALPGKAFFSGSREFKSEALSG
jgi:hypothetical protein